MIIFIITSNRDINPKVAIITRTIVIIIVITIIIAINITLAIPLNKVIRV